MVGGCAHDPAPVEQLRLTEQALVQARAVGPEASAELLQAEDKLRAARTALTAKDHREARMLAEQAELDARLAEVQALNERHQAQIDDLTRRIERLRQQLGEAR
ncbi:DUF4398 domain-containing protein [Pseudomonas lopnurensis]|uniref:DUF4398 domain-containing protein n=1 Tax=Pseudomonas lopnurensis TaxID=1477517 RepID=UPI0018795DF3|nr:DUF4398 domain-containing protein [Pseudomonas lopnurensis]MBE7374763.1 DUF4398 domain-containing protein [Pseudomonas lopnurensis]